MTSILSRPQWVYRQMDRYVVSKKLLYASVMRRRHLISDTHKVHSLLVTMATPSTNLRPNENSFWEIAKCDNPPPPPPPPSLTYWGISSGRCFPTSFSLIPWYQMSTNKIWYIHLSSFFISGRGGHCRFLCCFQVSSITVTQLRD